jgi:hypothetical protein
MSIVRFSFVSLFFFFDAKTLPRHEYFDDSALSKDRAIHKKDSPWYPTRDLEKRELEMRRLMFGRLRKPLFE